MNALQTTVLEGDAARVTTSPALADRAIREGWLTPGRFSFFLVILVFLTFSSVLLGRATFVFRDFGLFSYPVAFFHRQSFWRGELPLWNPYNYCGVPFLAQWNTMTLYPPSLLYLLVPLTWSLPFFCLVHLFWGGFGMYFLAHRWTDHRLAAALAGVIFSFNGLSLNFLMWPSHIAAFSWVPWVLWLVPEGWRLGGRKLLLGVLVASLQMLAGGPETILFTWIVLGLLAAGECIVGDDVRSLGGTDLHNREDSGLVTRGDGVVEFWSGGKTTTPPLQNSVLSFQDSLRRLLQRFRVLVRLLGMGFFVALICSAQLLPFLELVSHSQRNSEYSSISVDWSMPIWGWANFLVPMFRTCPNSQGVFFQLEQNWTSSYYVGLGTLLLASIALLRAREWRVALLTALLLLALVLALGNGGLLYRIVHFCLPLVGVVRYPVKFTIVSSMVFPLLAAFGLRELTIKTPATASFVWKCAGTAVLLVAGIVIFDWCRPLAQDTWHLTWKNGLARGGFLILMVLAVLNLRRTQGRKDMFYGGLLLAFVWLDLVTHLPWQNPTVSPTALSPGWAKAQLNWDTNDGPGQQRAMLAPVADSALRQHSLPRLEEDYLVKRLAFFADANLLDGVSQMYGLFSIAPAEIDNLVNLPYVQTNRDLSAVLDFMGVSRITAPNTLYNWITRPTAMPLVTAGQQPVFTDENAILDALVQTNLDLRKTALLPSRARNSISASGQTEARILDYQFQQQKVLIRTEAPAPSLVVISQSYFPAWKAFVDGRPVKIWRANYAFQALEVPEGLHQVQLLYHDGWLRIGFLLSGIGILGAIVLWQLSRLHWPLLSATRQPNEFKVETGG